MRRAPLQIRLIRCRELYDKSNARAIKYVLAVTAPTERQFVYDRIGIYDKRTQIFKINVFKLITWLSRDVRLTGNVMLLLERFRVFQDNEEGATNKRV